MKRQTYVIPPSETVVVEEAVLEEALDRVIACQGCSGSLSRSFGSVLTEAYGGRQPVAEYILVAPACCPSCEEPLDESTLVRCIGDDASDIDPCVFENSSPWLH
jgi:hypothetical protein